MRYISLFSGIEAASCAWEPLGWEPVAFAEIDEFPSAVLAHRWPDVPNLGDVSKVDWSKYRGAADVVVGGFPCFPADTLVLTDCGLTPIQDIKVGDMVLTHKGRYRKVVRTGSSVSDTVILKGQGSSGLECTPNHPFFSCKREYIWNNDRRSYDSYLGNTSWIHASDMAGKMWLNVNASLVNMKIPQFRMRGEESDFEYDESFFYFVGRWLGDGWVVATKRKNRGNSIQKRVHVCCAHELADDLQARLDETGLHFCRTEEPTVTKFVCVSVPLYDWLVSNFGKGADGKHLPPWVFGMPIEYREALFLGYIDSDGTPVKSGVRITSISKALTVGMKILAAGIGYTSSVVHVSNAREKCVIEGRTVNERPYFNQTYYSHSRSAVLCDSGFWGRVRKVLPGSRAVTVYNLEVEGDNSYTADGIAVHNCQSYSIAGLRQGLADPRGQLMLEFLRACSEIEPEWIVGENVPGLLSADGGRAFETFLNAVAILWPRGASLGGFWTASSCEYPIETVTEELPDGSVLSHSAAGVSFLSSILETGDVPQQYSLSPKACAGILRRAEKRGRSLPPMLEDALRSVVED